MQTQLPAAGLTADSSQPDGQVQVSTRRDKAGGDHKLVRTDRCGQKLVGFSLCLRCFECMSQALATAEADSCLEARITEAFSGD